MDLIEACWGAHVAAAGSVTGNRYDANFDAVHLDPARPLAVVADGLGDSPVSAFASRHAVDRCARELVPPRSPAALRAVVGSMHASVRDFARGHPDVAGCTLTALMDDAAGGWWLVQIGDSRAYRLRNGQLELLTVDHTAAWLGLLHGWFEHDPVAAQRARYRLIRYVGHPDFPDPDVLNIRPDPGDVHLLCTDGVSDQLSYAQIAEALTLSPAAAVGQLLEATLSAGGADNATAVVIR